MSTKQKCVACREAYAQEENDLCMGCEDAYWSGRVDEIMRLRRENGLRYT